MTAQGHMRYPLSNVLLYNGVTILHYLIGGLGLIIGYSFLDYGIYIGALYTVFAFVQMYLLMPLMVCPNCIYYSLKDAMCVSGFCVLSKKIAKKGDVENFSNRAKGICSHNNMYMGSLIIPIIGLIPAMLLNFSLELLTIFLSLVALMIFRVFVIFKRIACVHCLAKHNCPNAKSMKIK